MKSKLSFIALVVSSIILTCANTVEYSEEFKQKTAGKYLFNPDDIIEVYYDDNRLYLNWRDGRFKPVVLNQNEFFVADMYQKLRFVQDPETKKRYLSIIPENEDTKITYDYLKVPDTYKTPSAHLKDGNYDQALAGFLEVKKQDSTSSIINERDFNSKGYRCLRDKDYAGAIAIFKINVALYPSSHNVYDSLAEAYLLAGDSVQAEINFSKALELNSTNKRAKAFLEKISSK